MIYPDWFLDWIFQTRTNLNDDAVNARLNLLETIDLSEKEWKLLSRNFSYFLVKNCPVDEEAEEARKQWLKDIRLGKSDPDLFFIAQEHARGGALKESRNAWRKYWGDNWDPYIDPIDFQRAKAGRGARKAAKKGERKARLEQLVEMERLCNPFLTRDP